MSADPKNLPNWANKHSWWKLPLGGETVRSRWAEHGRCTKCGWGDERGFSDLFPKSDEFCTHCGVSRSETVRWVGRLVSYWDYGKLVLRRWEWVAWENLPKHLRDRPTCFEEEVAAEATRRLPELLEREVKARVAAELEVERLRAKGVE